MKRATSIIAIVTFLVVSAMVIGPAFANRGEHKLNAPLDIQERWAVRPDRPLPVAKPVPTVVAAPVTSPTVIPKPKIDPKRVYPINPRPMVDPKIAEPIKVPKTVKPIVPKTVKPAVPETPTAIPVPIYDPSSPAVTPRGKRAGKKGVEHARAMQIEKEKAKHARRMAQIEAKAGKGKGKSVETRRDNELRRHERKMRMLQRELR